MATKLVDGADSAMFLAVLKAKKLPEPVSEHRFAAPRRWRFDLAWPASFVREIST